MGKFKLQLITLTGFIVVSILACAALGIVTYLPESRIYQSFDNILMTFEVTSKTTIMIVGLSMTLLTILGLAYLLMIGWERWQQTRTDTTIKSLQAKEININILRQAIIFQSAAPGHQLYRHDVLENVTDPLHLSPGRINGYRRDPTESEITRWQAYQILFSRNTSGSGISVEPPAQDQPAQLDSGAALDLILKADRRMISGASGSGKTSLAQHIIWQEWLRGVPTIPIDPHHEGESMLGFPVIGAGRNYGQIEQAIEALYLCMDMRYKQAAAGFRFGQFDAWHIIIDELTAILANTGTELQEWLTLLIIESRKVRVRLTILGHSHNVADLNLSGPIRNSLSIWVCTGGNGEPVGPVERMRAEGSRLKPDGQYLHPGPFDGRIEQAVILDIPPADIIRARGMAADGMSPTAIARAIFKTDKPNGAQIKQVREWYEGQTKE